MTSRVRTALRILNVRLRFIVLLLLTGLIAAKWDTFTAYWERWTSHPASSPVATEAVEYYCPMHPSVVRDAPGNCPICGMSLARRLKGAAPEHAEGTMGRVTLSPYRMHLAGVATSEVTARELHRVIRTFGTVELEERRVSRISARVAGRVEKVFADYPDGGVAEGEPLVELYSPDVIATEREYLVAASAAKTDTTARPIADAARERLRLWGIADQDIAALENAGEASARVVLRSPVGGTITKRDVYEGQYVTEGTELYEIADLSGVWVTGSVPEGEVSGVRSGMPVEVEVTAFSGRAFAGVIDFIEPTVAADTRTVRVRARVSNSGGELRPGMYAEIRIAAPAMAATSGGTRHATARGDVYVCPMKCDGLTFTAPGKCPVCGMDLVKVPAPPAGSTLAVPESAVIDTGTRKVVYVEREPGVFDAVEIELGPLADGYYPVLRGLSEGDRVVTSGAFLVDAELRLSPGAAGSYFGASGGPSSPPGEHRH